MTPQLEQQLYSAAQHLQQIRTMQQQEEVYSARQPPIAAAAAHTEEALQTVWPHHGTGRRSLAKQKAAKQLNMVAKQNSPEASPRAHSGASADSRRASPARSDDTHDWHSHQPHHGPPATAHKPSPAAHGVPPPAAEPASRTAKWCAGCQESKPLVEFSRDAYSRDGYQTACKACKKRYYIERRMVHGYAVKNKSPVLVRSRRARTTAPKTEQEEDSMPAKRLKPAPAPSSPRALPQLQQAYPMMGLPQDHTLSLQNQHLSADTAKWLMLQLPPYQRQESLSGEAKTGCTTPTGDSSQSAASSLQFHQLAAEMLQREREVAALEEALLIKRHRYLREAAELEHFEAEVAHRRGELEAEKRRINALKAAADGLGAQHLHL